MRTETFTFVGDSAFAVAMDAPCPAALPPTPAAAFAVAVLDWSTAPSAPGLFTRTEMFVLDGMSWFAVPVACDVWPPFVEVVDALASAAVPFCCVTAPFAPGWSMRVETFVFDGFVCPACAPAFASEVLVVPLVDGGVALVVVPVVAGELVSPAPVVDAGVAFVAASLVGELVSL